MQPGKIPTFPSHSKDVAIREAYSSVSIQTIQMEYIEKYGLKTGKSFPCDKGLNT